MRTAKAFEAIWMSEPSDDLSKWRAVYNNCLVGYSSNRLISNQITNQWDRAFPWTSQCHTHIIRRSERTAGHLGYLSFYVQSHQRYIVVMVLDGGKRKEQRHLFMRLVQFKYYEQLIQPTQVSQHPLAVCKLCLIIRDAEIYLLKTHLCKM